MATFKTFSSIDKGDIGKKHTFFSCIDEIRQTTGPTVFSLNDGTARLKATAFVKPGERALPELNEGDCIKTELFIKDRAGAIEGEINSWEKLSEEESVKLKENIKKSEEEKLLPEVNEFLIKSANLEKLKPLMVSAAIEIKRAIRENRPIIIRHHGDTDGYCAAVALERAILPLIKEHHGSDKASYIYYKRSPSKSPYWDYADVTKDLSSALSGQERYNQNPPLIILCDLGDTDENILAVKKVKIYDAKVIVIDHHYPENENIVNFVDVFINPYLVGFDYSLVTGMICTEIARMINRNVKKINFMPALAGTGDKSDKQEFEDYLKISGYDREFLKKWALCIDFEASYLKYLEGRDLVEDLFADDRANHKKLINLIYPEIEKRFEETRTVVNKFKTITEMSEFKLVKIECDKVMTKDEFPNSSKIVRVTHETTEGSKITLGILPDTVIFRVEGVDKFSVNSLVDYLSKKLPYALINGGGHDFAGAIKFIKAAREEVLTEIENYVRSI